MRILFFLLLVISASSISAQKIELLASTAHASFRGLSVVDDQVVWVSGSNGVVGRSLDGGKTWEWITVPGHEKNDFRDIEAFDKNTAVIMAIATPAIILKTRDGGKTWQQVYENNTPGMFLDAMDFWNKDSGIVLGDPIKGRFFIAHTFDGGDSWHEVPSMSSPPADSGEACFASSGTNIRVLGKKTSCIVTGGVRSRLLLRNDKAIELPIQQGRETTGANSIAIQDPQHFVVVGGDFTHDTVTYKNCALTQDGGTTWAAPTVPPHGYRSCVEYIEKNKLICCGTSGVDVSTDGGMSWQLIDTGNFHVCRKAKKGHAVFLAGGNGRIGKLTTF